MLTRSSQQLNAVPHQTISCKINKEYETEKIYNQIVAENMVGYIMLQFVMYLLCCMVIVSKYKTVII